MGGEQGARAKRRPLHREQLEARLNEPSAPLLTVYDAADCRLNRPGVRLLAEVCGRQGLVTTQPDALLTAMLEEDRVMVARPQVQRSAEAFPVFWRSNQPRLNLSAVFAEYGIKVPPDRILDIPLSIVNDEEWGDVLAFDFGRIQDRPREGTKSPAV